MTDLAMHSITSIEGLSDERRLPRNGKVRIGERRMSKGGKEYPSALDHFKFDQETLDALPVIAEIYADRETGEIAPRELDIVFPAEERSVIFPQALKYYGSARGLKCKGNGKEALRTTCAQCGRMECECKNALTTLEKVACPCSLRESGKCKPVGSLMFILPRVSWGGVFQLDTGSINSIIDLNSGIELTRKICKQVSLVPLKLRLVARQVRPDGRVKTVHTLQVAFDGGLADIRRIRAGAVEGPAIYQIEPPHDDGDDLPAILDGDPADPDPADPADRDEMDDVSPGPCAPHGPTGPSGPDTPSRPRPAGPDSGGAASWLDESAAPVDVAPSPPAEPRAIDHMRQRAGQALKRSLAMACVVDLENQKRHVRELLMGEYDAMTLAALNETELAAVAARAEGGAIDWIRRCFKHGKDAK